MFEVYTDSPQTSAVAPLASRVEAEEKELPRWVVALRKFESPLNLSRGSVRSLNSVGRDRFSGMFFVSPNSVLSGDLDRMSYLVWNTLDATQSSFSITLVEPLKGPRDSWTWEGLEILGLGLAEKPKLHLTSPGKEQVYVGNETEPHSDQLRNNEYSEINDRIVELECSKKIPHRAALANRLRFLLSEAENESEPLRLESLRALVSFFQTEADVFCPDLVLTPAGNFRAEWWKANNRFLAVEFLSDTTCRYVLFTKGTTSQETERVSGTASLHTFLSDLSKYRINEWIRG